MKILAPLSLCLLLPLAGCQNSSYSYVYETPYDEPWRVPPKGTIVELKQELTFRPGSSRVYIQDGEASSAQSSVDEYRPWCKFYLHESKEAMKNTRSIQPDRFTVTRASQNVQYVQAKPITVAAAGFGTPFISARDDAGAQSLATTLRLHSDNQPQVRELLCAVSDDMRRDHWVSVNRIQATLGDVVQLHLPALE